MLRVLMTLMVLGLLSCNQGTNELVDGEDESFIGPDGKTDTGDVEEGSVEACGVLRLVNEATVQMLDDSPPEGAGLDRRAAQNIVYHRVGDDGQEGTEDDNPFDDLAELDNVSYVGPVAFGLLLEFAHENGFVGACLDEISEPDRFSFFVMGDSRSHPEVLEAISAAMVEMAPGAIAAFNTGDITSHGTYSQWTLHMETLAAGAPDPTVPEDPAGVVRQSRIRSDVDDFGSWIRYIGVIGNHDDNNGEWFGSWNTFLPGQQHLGVNAVDGIYFTLHFGNTLFIVLDSVNPSEEQTQWLRDVLESDEAAEATWIFPFLHHPIYPCNTKEPFHDGLEWVELFEQHDIELVFVAHSHTYERTCPMRGGRCEEGGVIYLNSSAAGAPVRAVTPERQFSVEYDGRTDEFDCSEILEEGWGYWDHFTHVEIDHCRLTLSAYSHDWASTGGPPRDTLVIDRCE